MIDTHAHLDACEDSPRELLNRARAARVSRVITIGSGISSCREALRIADAEEGVFAALGIHPHQAGSAGQGDISDLEQLLNHPAAVAMGETGLDYYRDYAPRARQRELFSLQAELASALSKPLVVHTRAADRDTVDVLRRLPEAVTVVLHCFSSSELLEPALERGWYVSFAGNVTYPKATDLRWAAAQVPEDRILAETDCPYLSPQPVRGKPNEPAHVRHALAVLALARGRDAVELEAVIDANAAAAFGLP